MKDFSTKDFRSGYASHETKLTDRWLSRTDRGLAEAKVDSSMTWLSGQALAISFLLDQNKEHLRLYVSGQLVGLGHKVSANSTSVAPLENDKFIGRVSATSVSTAGTGELARTISVNVDCKRLRR